MSRSTTCAAVAALAVLALANGAALAEDKPAGTSFESLDKNADGKLSLDEASANDKLFTVFKGLDANKDGALSKTEFAAYDPAGAAKG
jgi:Ca2+-binding EF-hand superfamily protein